MLQAGSGLLPACFGIYPFERAIMNNLSSYTKPLSLFSQVSLSRRLVLMPLFGVALLIGAILWRITFPSAPLVDTSVAPIDSASASAIVQMENRLQRFPDDPNAYAQLGLVLLQHVRESGDSGLYGRAGDAFEQALEREPDNLDALIGQGMLAAALHDFDAAIQWADKAREINPWRAEVLGILVDAYVELGRYEEAVAATQQMVDLRPSLDSYSRVSYIRELYGDVDGAILAMEAAVGAGVPGTEAVLWSQYQLGNLHLLQGNLEEAQALYAETLAAKPNYLYGQVGLARIKLEEGKYAAGAEILKTVTAQSPMPEFVILLADAYVQLGMDELAQEQFELVGVLQQLSEASGMNMDFELAAFAVEYGAELGLAPEVALELAERAYEATPTIFAADTLAWALFKNGEVEAADGYSKEALRLGTQDPLLHAHADAIDQAVASMAATAADTSSASTASTSSQR